MYFIAGIEPFGERLTSLGVGKHSRICQSIITCGEMGRRGNREGNEDPFVAAMGAGFGGVHCYGGVGADPSLRVSDELKEASVLERNCSEFGIGENQGDSSDLQLKPGGRWQGRR